MTRLPRLRLKRHEDRRLRQGHLWVFSNEVDTKATPLKDFAPGDLVAIENSAGLTLGIGYVNPKALICARLLSRDPSQTIDSGFWHRRLAAALAWRESLFSAPFYRLVHGEGDGLPGLVVDRFGKVCVIQCNTAGIERQLESILGALGELLNPQAIVLRNDSFSRTLEGLPQQVTVLGTLPDTVLVEENRCRFQIDPVLGQKTGWFYDHRQNRVHAAALAKDLKLLDLFCYSGTWGIQAAACGAREVIGVDSSAAALELARENARLNGVEQKVRFVQADVFEFLKQIRQEKLKFDLIILDPPAFIKRRKDIAQGIEGYRRLHKLATACLTDSAILVSCSCSHHLAAQKLQQLVAGAALRNAREAALFARGHPGPDHPIHPAILETDYLKAQFYRVLAWR